MKKITWGEKMDFEIEWNYAGIAFILWLIMAGTMLYIPKVMDTRSYIDVWGWFWTLSILIVLLPIAYFIVKNRGEA